MESEATLKKRKLTWFLLFVGFCCVFGWLATNFILMTHYTNWRHFADIGAILQTLLMALTCTSFFVVIGAGVFIWANRRLKRTERKQGLIVKSLIPAALLTPLLGIVGMALIILAPFAFAHIHALVMGPNVVQSVNSPDGRYQAYVIDKPSIDGPNHHLFINDTVEGTEMFIENLPEDVDFNKEILWSPHSDIVVFRSHFKLIANCPATGQTKEAKLGGDYHWRKSGTFWVDYRDVKKPYDLQFPQAGVFTYRLEQSDEIFSLTFNDKQAL